MPNRGAASRNRHHPEAIHVDVRPRRTPKPAEGKIHDLWAKALVLEDAAGKRCLLIALNLVGIDKQLADDVCADLRKQHGFERDQVMLACSHTHCGPVVGKNLIAMYNFDEKQHELVKNYTKELHGQLVELAGAAVKSIKPAKLTWGNGHISFAMASKENPGVRLAC